EDATPARLVVRARARDREAIAISSPRGRRRIALRRRLIAQDWLPIRRSRPRSPGPAQKARPSAEAFRRRLERIDVAGYGLPYFKSSNLPQRPITYTRVNTTTQTPSTKCQYHETTSTPVIFFSVICRRAASPNTIAMVITPTVT